jgi:hypothetical protein
MFFGREGLILQTDGYRTIYHNWDMVHALYDWIVVQEKPYQTFPQGVVSRQVVGYILAYYPEEMGWE